MNTKLFYSFFIFLLTTSCVSNKINFHKKDIQIKCVEIKTQGYINLEIHNNHKKYSFLDASKNAIYKILHSGVSSEVCKTQPPLLESVEEKENFTRIKKSFFSNKGVWLNFIQNNKTDNENQNIYHISIAKDNLRIYLEEKNIIKKIHDGY